MKITSKEQYEAIPNKTPLKLFLDGDCWDEDCGASILVVKIDNRLYEAFVRKGGINAILIYQNSYWDFEEMNDTDGYSFSLAALPSDHYLMKYPLYTLIDEVCSTYFEGIVKNAD